MSDGVTAWLSSGHVVDIAIAVIALEAIALLTYHRFTGRGLAARDYIVNLVAGLSLMLALRAALGGAPWPWLVLALIVAGIAHATDLRLRTRRT